MNQPGKKPANETRDGMLPQQNVQSFIVKIWIEEISEGANKGSWRGHITHIPSNERRYVKSLDEITSYFRQYINSIGFTI